MIILPLTAIGQHKGDLAPLWQDYLDARQKGETPILPDFSYAGYHFSEKEIPELSDRKHFNVRDYGAIPNDRGYDDEAIQKAIDAAEANPGGGVVFFPPGKYLISPDNDPDKGIRISRSRIVLKGSGAGEGGTEIFQDSMRIEKRQFHFRPTSLDNEELAVIIKDAPRESFWVVVADVSKLKPGQDVVIRHKSEAYTRLYFDSLPLAPEWTRLFGEDGGMKISEIHTIEKIEGNRVKFRNPLHLNIRMIEGKHFTIHSYSSLEECGIEDILFSSNWVNYAEEFVHHKNSIHDSGWCAVSMEYVKDSWIRNCEFRDLNESIFMRSAYRVSVSNVVFSGKKGHSSVHARTGYGVLIRNCRFDSNTLHGPATGYGAAGTVISQCTMQKNQNIDSHSGQPYATLFDDVQGGVFRGLGGPLIGLPHHGKYLVFWNFRHSSTYDFHYKFWDTRKRRNHTIAQPIFVGFDADRKITFEDEGINQLPGKTVEPRSLFEAQLALRLRSKKGMPEDEP